MYPVVSTAMDDGIPKSVNLSPQMSGCRMILTAQYALLPNIGTPRPFWLANSRSVSCTSLAPGKYSAPICGNSSAFAWSPMKPSTDGVSHVMITLRQIGFCGSIHDPVSGPRAST